ncbi:MAG: site-2 protease family protein [Candidatus Eisenbacteria bacterium]|uniref:Site-2 protease family protein n=1 Tax=Eiseniibacteriota bacterium TaxID=2212470 RepID=A0A849SJY1_UNCEI|nr:site-2 protease family protein [Candidatus Eisenbacteria bacterium]
MPFDPDVLLAVPVLVLSVVVHECAHGVAALWCGDPTARDSGRLTLNPLRHIDPIGSLLLPGVLLLLKSPFLFAWAKPVPIEASRLRQPRNDMVKVAMAGPLSNALLALAFALLARVAPEQGLFAPLRVMGLIGVIANCALGLFNLLPIPPLDGSWLLMRFLPFRHVRAIQRFRLAGLAVVAVLLAVPAISRVVFMGPLEAVVSLYLTAVGLSPGEVLS